jgi:hypothetical protein
MPAALERRDRLTYEDVAERAKRYPLLAELAADHLTRLSEKGVAVDKAPRMVSLLAQDGSNSDALLRGVEQVVARFDGLRIPGWNGPRRRLASESRPAFMAVLSELVIATWALEVGYSIVEFEPTLDNGRRADLALRRGITELVVEVATPFPPDADWTERANDRLRAGIQRVCTGLVVDIDGYEPLHFEPGGPWGEPIQPVSDSGVDAVVHEFARAAAKGRDATLPLELVAPHSAQPVRIVATGRTVQADRTHVRMGWSKSGLVPPVERLARIVGEERKQLPRDRPGAILVDLSNWSDFKGDRYYLGEVANRLAWKHAEILVGTFDWAPPSMLPYDRYVLCGACQSMWSQPHD